MPKRIFTKTGETPRRYRCTNKKCKWEGTDDEKGRTYFFDGSSIHTCPNCKNDTFYGLR